MLGCNRVLGLGHACRTRLVINPQVLNLERVGVRLRVRRRATLDPQRAVVRVS